VPFLQEPLGTVALTAGELTVVLALAIAPAVLTEAAKAVTRRR
jgi:hypothetical protein